MDSCYPLPGKRINIDETSYFVHGLVHNSPLVSISQDFKDFVRNEFRGYDLICEDGFVNWIENATSFNESSYFKLDKPNLFDIFKVLALMTYSKFIKRNPSSLIQQVQKMKSPEDFYHIREELFKNYPLEPFGMNSLLLKLGNGNLESPKRDIPLCIKRYVYEAKESLKHAKEKSLKELHIIVGCAHELPLEYLLKNQELLNGLKV